MLQTTKGEKLGGELICATQIFTERKSRKKRKEELSLSQYICSSGKDLSGEGVFAFFQVFSGAAC